METREARLGRLWLRSMRRGTREMDLILGSYAERHLERMDDAALTAWEALIAEDDHMLMRWLLGVEPSPAAHAALVARVAEAAVGLTAPE
ncbi:MAG: succinate dehydrogenase assembly factor 2 [Rubellimicrobium sp.]|nr:succinate dehydrogenase assembly factor 2 [Rubellimicrobium sp.]